MIFVCMTIQMFIILTFSYANDTVDDENPFKTSGNEDFKEAQEIHKNITSDWTSCEEFLANTTFDVSSVVDIDWQIFYFWNYNEEESYNIRFSIPTSILVDRFAVGLKDMHHGVNWSQAALFMETSIDFSALYIFTDTPGKFRLVPSFVFGMDHFPNLTFGLKYVEPGYLSIMNCDHKFCYALAPSDKMPEKHITLEAEKIGFRGDSNYSYLVQKTSPFVHDDLDEHEDDAEDEEEFEIENQLDEL